MTKQTPPKRKYDSSRRRLQAQATRRQIAESARSLFIQRGYDGTTIDAIAQAAEVAPETIYATFGSKRKILWFLVDISVGGDDDSIRLMDRPGPQAVLQETDPSRQVIMFSYGISEILSRTAPIFEILRSAAKTDQELADLLQRLLVERLQNMTTFVQAIANHDGLRDELSISTAADLVWTITSPEVFLLLTRDRKYSQDRYTDWLQAALSYLLLDVR
jgi:AcrR family transcriptional regulator